MNENELKDEEIHRLRMIVKNALVQLCFEKMDVIEARLILLDGLQPDQPLIAFTASSDSS